MQSFPTRKPGLEEGTFCQNVRRSAAVSDVAYAAVVAKQPYLLHRILAVTQVAGTLPFLP